MSSPRVLTPIAPVSRHRGVKATRGAIGKGRCGTEQLVRRRPRTARPSSRSSSTAVRVGPQPRRSAARAGVARLLLRRPWQPRSNNWCLWQAFGSGGRKPGAGRFRVIWGRHPQFREVLMVASPGRDLPAAVGALWLRTRYSAMGSIGPRSPSSCLLAGRLIRLAQYRRRRGSLNARGHMPVDEPLGARAQRLVSVVSPVEHTS
jgi:hypothetical protein